MVPRGGGDKAAMTLTSCGAWRRPIPWTWRGRRTQHPWWINPCGALKDSRRWLRSQSPIDFAGRLNQAMEAMCAA